MYKFLICRPKEEDQTDDWCYSFNSKMYPDFSTRVKEAILIGYRSKKQDRWITSGTSIHLVENYKKVRKAFPDTEMCLIVLGNNLTDTAINGPYFRSYPAFADDEFA